MLEYKVNLLTILQPNGKILHRLASTANPFKPNFNPNRMIP